MLRRNKFSPRPRDKPERLNCVPYVELKSSKGPLRFLIDTGANKNYIKPEHVNKSRKSEKVQKVQSVNGIFTLDRFINFNPFPQSKSCESAEFFVFDFHNFFDGLIGYEFLQKSQATIDASQNELHFQDLSIRMKRKHPELKLSTLNSLETKVIKISINSADGDFLLNEDIEIKPSVYVNSGLYNVSNKVAYVAVQISQIMKFQSPCLK